MSYLIRVLGLKEFLNNFTYLLNEATIIIGDRFCENLEFTKKIIDIVIKKRYYVYAFISCCRSIQEILPYRSFPLYTLYTHCSESEEGQISKHILDEVLKCIACCENVVVFGVSKPLKPFPELIVDALILDKNVVFVDCSLEFLQYFTRDEDLSIR